MRAVSEILRCGPSFISALYTGRSLTNHNYTHSPARSGVYPVRSRDDAYVRMDNMSHGGEIFGLGGDAASEPSFETALRGYEKKQVERYVARAENEIAALAAEREQAYRRSRRWPARSTSFSRRPARSAGSPASPPRSRSATWARRSSRSWRPPRRWPRTSRASATDDIAARLAEAERIRVGGRGARPRRRPRLRDRPAARRAEEEKADVARRAAAEKASTTSRQAAEQMRAEAEATLARARAEATAADRAGAAARRRSAPAPRPTATPSPPGCQGGPGDQGPARQGPAGPRRSSGRPPIGSVAS